MTRPFRFGVMASSAASRAALMAKARRAEELGYWSFLFNDHYAGPGPAMSGANHAPQEVAAIPAIALAAEATETIRVGFRVLCVDYHHPVVLAKELASLDLFSEGRLEIGLGAGWIKNEYEAMGIPYDPPGVRIARLGEVTELIKAALGGGPVSVVGHHGVSASGFEGSPRPVQRPHPPIAIGGGGRKLLELAAREADIVAVNINNRTGVLGPESLGHATAALTLEKVGWIREAAGTRRDEIELEIGAYFATVTDDPSGVAEPLVGFVAPDLDAVLEHPHALIGSVDAICDTLEERRERFGFSYVTVLERSFETFAPVVARLVGR